MSKIKIKSKEEIKKAEDEKRRHAVGLMKSLSELFTDDYLQIARKIEKKLEKQTA